MQNHSLLSRLIPALAVALALTACGGGGNSTDSSSTSGGSTTTSQLVHRDNVNDAKGAYDRVSDGMTLEQAKVFLGNPDLVNKGSGNTPDGSIVDAYQWAFADGTILQLTYKNGRLWRKILGNMNQTLVSFQYF